MGNNRAVDIYTATEECLVTLNGYVGYTEIANEVTMVANIYIEGKVINASSSIGRPNLALNIQLSSIVRLKRGEKLKLQVGSSQTVEKATANIHYFLKVLPLVEKVTAPI